MTVVPSDPAALDLPFKYVGGDASLDLINTVDWTSRGPEQERLADFDALLRWSVGAKTLGNAEIGRLRRAAASRPRDARAVHAKVIRLRAILRRLFTAIAARKDPGASLAEFNAMLQGTLRRRRLQVTSTGRVSWVWVGSGHATDVSTPMWPVVIAAAQLLQSDEIDKVEVCGGEDCGWMYVNRSRNRLRRWCQMETCGTRAKSIRRYQRSHRGRRPPSSPRMGSSP